MALTVIKVSIAIICALSLHAYESNGWQTSQPPRCQRYLKFYYLLCSDICSHVSCIDYV